MSNIEFSDSISEEEKALIGEATEKTLEYLKFTKEYYLSVSIVSERAIQELNKKYRDIDEPTDVLSFPQDDFDSAAPVLGDIVICRSVCKRQAEKGIEHEIAMLTIHSVLHLFGFDHNEDDLSMFDIQNKILEGMF